MYVLDSLWAGRVSPCARAYECGSRYEALFREACKSERRLWEMLSAEGKKAYESCREKQMEVDRLSDYDAFLRGFRLGAGIILDIISDRDYPMIQAGGPGRTE